MAKKDFMESRQDEIDALKELEGVDPKEIMRQAEINQGLDPDDKPPGDPPPGDPPPGDPPPGAEPGGTPPDDPPPGDPPPGDPPPGDPPKGDPPPDTGQVQTVFMKEIFGEQFQTVDELKAADLPSQLQELATLREEKQTFEVKLAAKPKTSFVNDDIALFNEFVKETGNSNFGIFKVINSTDIANMDPMDALVKEHILKHPVSAGQESTIRKRFERKYNLDSEQVEAGELAENKLGLQEDGERAKSALLEVKGKLKIPEPEEETTPPPGAPPELTPEAKQSLQTGWTQMADRMSKELGTLQIAMKDSKQPVISYQVDSELLKTAVQDASNYCVENRMEFNEKNLQRVAELMYNRLLVQSYPEIMHSVFEKARSLTEEQVTALFENPSPSRNTDTPPGPPPLKLTPEEEIEEKLFKAEMDR